MRKKQLLFFCVAVFYGLLHLVYFMKGEFLSPPSAIVPGWHVEIEYSNSYQKTFTIIYFFLVALVYGAHPYKNIPTWIFRLHFVCSIIPAFSILLWPLFFSTSFFNIEELDREYLASFYMEQFFLFSQLIFIVCLFFFQLRKKTGSTEQLS